MGVRSKGLRACKMKDGAFHMHLAAASVCALPVLERQRIVTLGIIGPENRILLTCLCMSLVETPAWATLASA
jgi:hypothetical protein